MKIKELKELMKPTITNMDILKDNPENEYIQFDRITQKVKEKYEHINDPFFKYNGEVEKLQIEQIYINVKINRLIEYFKEIKKQEENKKKNDGNMKRYQRILNEFFIEKGGENAKNGKKSGTIQKNSNKNKKNKCQPDN